MHYHQYEIKNNCNRTRNNDSYTIPWQTYNKNDQKTDKTSN